MNKKQPKKKRELKKDFTPFHRSKTVNGHQYIYQITPYRDPVTGKIRQHSTYLGKPTDNPDQVEKVRTSPKPLQHLVSFGDAYLYHSLVSELGIDSILKQCFSEEETNWILLLVGYKLLHNGSLERLASYMETSDLSTYYPVSTCISSQQSSRVLERLGEDRHESISHFFLQWTNHHPIQGDNLLYDLTSFSSQAKAIEWLEQGYNRDHLPLPQINTGLLVNETIHLPLYYKLYPGSIKDIATLHNLIQELNCMGIQQITIILDRGFYSRLNLLDLIEHQISFILPLPLTSKTLYETILEQSSVLKRSVTEMIQIDKHFYYAKSGTILLPPEVLEEKETEEAVEEETESTKQTAETAENKTEKKPVVIHYVISLDPQRYEDEMDAFYSHLLEAEDILQKMDWNDLLPPPTNPGHPSQDSSDNESKQRKEAKQVQKKLQQRMKNKVGSYNRYFTVKREPSGAVILERNEEAVNQHTKFFGIMILLTSQPMDPKTLLKRYRERDRVEKMFDAAKNELIGLPLRVHKTNTMNGLFFILFIALIVQFHLLNKMSKENLQKKYSIADIFFELHKLKKTIWYGKDRILNELTKTQRTILEALQVFVPKIMRS